MIQANELRLGNIINIGGNTIDTYQTYKPCKVNINVLKDIVQENMERPEAILSAWQPIPLTPELLEECSLIYDGEYFVIKNSYFELKPTEDGKFQLTINSAEYETKLIVEYLHQLQNLYFALTGEELEIALQQ